MKLWSELKRRNVLRMAALYAVIAWLVLQVTDVLVGLVDLPDWLGPAVLAIVAIGLPITLGVTWFFQLTDAGVIRDEDTRAGTEAGASGRQLDVLIISLLAAAVLVFAWVTWWPDRPADRSVAVLPFDNMSGDPAQEYFSDGIAEELLGTLARSPELRVISRSSSFSFKDRNLDVPTIASELNVAHVVEGSVRKAGNRLRISAQLIEAKSDASVWSATFERDLSAANLFEIQTQIATSIADSLNAVLATREDGRTEHVPTRNLEALEAYLLGKQRMALRSHSGLTRAVDYFSAALDIDPGYAAAYLGLADATLLLRNYGHTSLSEALAVAEPALERALELDPRLGGAYASLGLMRSLQGDPRAAVEQLEKAITLDPNAAKAYHWLGDILIYGIGDPEAAIPKLETARHLDPLSPIIIVTLGEAHSAIGNLAEAMRLYSKAVDIDPDYIPAQRLLGLTYLALDDPDAASIWLDRSEAKSPDEFGAVFGKAFLYRSQGDEERASKLAHRLEGLQPGNNVTLVTLVSFDRDDEVIEIAEADWPALSCSSDPVVSRSNIFQAMNLSLAYERTGQVDCSHALLEAILSLLAQPDVQPRSFGFLDVEVYSRQGRLPEALQALRERVDAGVRQSWWSQIEQSPHTVRLRQDPGYAAIRDEVRADLAQQLATVREMEARAELRPGSE